jgi:hypothetical protein
MQLLAVLSGSVARLANAARAALAAKWRNIGDSRGPMKTESLHKRLAALKSAEEKTSCGS